MKLTDLLTTEKSEAKAGNWSSVDVVCGAVVYRRICHYSTCMLEFRKDTEQITFDSIGNGSVSDQQVTTQVRMTPPLFNCTTPTTITQSW